MTDLLIKNATIVNENSIFSGHVWIKAGNIHRIMQGVLSAEEEHIPAIDANRKMLIPGVIDEHVHFREPGLTHKADIATESKAAVAGGVTSFMEMPNTLPQTTSLEALGEKFERAAQTSLANYSFYIGATNENPDELLKINPSEVCGIKLFMGSSTGNIIADNQHSLERIFSESSVLIATHCEDEQTIRSNLARYRDHYGDKIPFSLHPKIRSEEACFKSSSLAVELATRYNSRLHILHVSTAKELALFSNQPAGPDKRITAEVCTHHLWFDDTLYDKLGSRIKWNPAIKTPRDKKSLLKGLLNNKIDVIATDHAPHTEEEKNNAYLDAPSGGPLIQHSLPAMLEFYHQKKISLEKIVEKMCHAPAILYGIEKRGFIREGYRADLTLVDLHNPLQVTKENILYKCNWSPFEGTVFKSRILLTIVNGNLVYNNGNIDDSYKGEKLIFTR